jgi:hypothetical protein
MRARPGSRWRTVFVSEQPSPSTRERAHASGLVDQFTDKLVSHYKGDDVTSAVVLVNNGTETGWFQRPAAVASAVCFPRAGCASSTPTGIRVAPRLQGQVLLYPGPDVLAFVQVFSRFGCCWLCEDS